MYVKVSGSWEDSQPFVKHEGVWKEPVIYKKSKWCLEKKFIGRALNHDYTIW